MECAYYVGVFGALVRLRGLAPSLLVLVVGFALGAFWTADSTTPATAQSPIPASHSIPSELLRGHQSAGQAGNDGQLVPSGGDRITVIESRGGRDVAGSGDLIGFSHVNASGTLAITLVDTQKLWMTVYHVGPGGEIQLTSSRAIDADFSLQLNATSPMPDEIRRLQGLPPRQ